MWGPLQSMHINFLQPKKDIFINCQSSSHHHVSYTFSVLHIYSLTLSPVVLHFKFNLFRNSQMCSLSLLSIYFSVVTDYITAFKFIIYVFLSLDYFLISARSHMTSFNIIHLFISWFIGSVLSWILLIAHV